MEKEVPMSLVGTCSPVLPLNTMEKLKEIATPEVRLTAMREMPRR